MRRIIFSNNRDACWRILSRLVTESINSSLKNCGLATSRINVEDLLNYFVFVHSNFAFIKRQKNLTHFLVNCAIANSYTN